MTTLLATFFCAIIISLALTPIATKLGMKLGAIDIPNERKMHSKPIPRSGGWAIFLAFISALLLTKLVDTDVSNQLTFNTDSMLMLFGGIICFSIGMVDDFIRLNHRVKFVAQIVAAIFACAGGLAVERFQLLGNTIEFGLLAYPITILWFLVFINAINLIDGLDGLAGGVVFFTSSIMIVLSVLKGQGDYVVAMLFAALSGSILGFLRYNFNPASVFLGDGGSYFLGYAIASLSLFGSVKSQVSALILIPLIALGVPLFDTLISPLRRFAVGKRMFYPDSGHVHHQLLKKGLTKRNAVLVIYAITAGLCIFALIIVNIRDERSGLFIFLIGAGAIFFARKLGYLEYVASDKIVGWFKDLTDDAGISKERRTFLNVQIDISNSMNFSELWARISVGFDMLKFDLAEIRLNEKNKKYSEIEKYPLVWCRNGFRVIDEIEAERLMKIEMPLIDRYNENLGSIMILKDLSVDPISHYTLRRVEHLRRTIIRTLEKLNK